VNTLGEKRRRPNEPTPEIYLQGGPESSASALIPGSPAVQLPSTRRPKKRRKVAFNCDPVTSETTHPAQSPSLSGNDVGPSSPNPAPASTARTKSSTQVPTPISGKPKPNTTRVTHQDDEAIMRLEMSSNKGKKKDGPPKERESLPDHGKSNRGDIGPSTETQGKRKRKKTKQVAPEPAAGR
jgi:hypothetical protein